MLSKSCVPNVVSVKGVDAPVAITSVNCTCTEAIPLVSPLRSICIESPASVPFSLILYKSFVNAKVDGSGFTLTVTVAESVPSLPSSIV